jgi:homoserine dehydrogenase
MKPVNIGIIGLGNVGEGTMTILTENAAHIEAKLGFPLHIAAVCSRGIATKHQAPFLRQPIGAKSSIIAASTLWSN